MLVARVQRKVKKQNRERGGKNGRRFGRVDCCVWRHASEDAAKPAPVQAAKLGLQPQLSSDEMRIASKKIKHISRHMKNKAKGFPKVRPERK